jgi:hypothetical protein
MAAGVLLSGDELVENSVVRTEAVSNFGVLTYCFCGRRPWQPGGHFALLIAGCVLLFACIVCLGSVACVVEKTNRFLWVFPLSSRGS